MPEISVVVCTFNRAAWLRPAVESLLQQQTRGAFTFEVVVVDNASTDHTQQVIESLAAESGGVVRGCRELQQGVSHARNRGIAEAQGEWIAFFDDDQEAAPDWLFELWQTAHSQQCRVVGGAVELELTEQQSQTLGPLAQAMYGATVGRDQLQPYTRKFAPGTGNLMVHREVFQQVGVFDPALADAGEDTDLYRRIRAASIASWYTPQARILHKIPAERLQPEHLCRTAQRIGGHIARREHQSAGSWVFAVLLLARLLQTGLSAARSQIKAVLRGDRAQSLDTRIILARGEGYLRTGLRELAPRWFEQQAYFSGLNFRADRNSASGSTT